MPLVGLATAFVAAVLAELGGNDTTRGFTRSAFWVLALVEMGLTLSGLHSFAADAVGVVL